MPPSDPPPGVGTDSIEQGQSRRTPLRWAILLAVLTVQLVFLFDPVIQGDHFFRQTGVMSNVEKMVQDGLFSAPATYNRDAILRLFDFPLYQFAVAAIVEITGMDAVLAARLSSIVITLLTLIAADVLFRETGMAGGTRALALCLIAAAPIQLYYGAGALPDGLCVMLSLCCLGWTLRFQRTGRRGFLVIASLAALVGSLIKSPVMLPAILALVWWQFRRDGWSALCRAGLLAPATAALAGMTLHRVVSMIVNAGSPGYSPGDYEWYWYFSNLEDRTSWAPYGTLLRTLAKKLLNPVTLALAAVGVVSLARRPRTPYREFLVGWLLASGATVLLFFNLHWRHNYYQLPFVPPLACLAAIGIERTAAWISAHATKTGPTLVRGAVVSLVLVTTVFFAAKYTGRLAQDRTRDLRIAGNWLQEHTTPDAFVLYLLRDYDWNPAQLYFAHRDGRNVALDALDKGLRTIAAAAGAGHRPLFAFLPRDAGGRLVDARERLGAPVAEGAAGWLFQCN